VVDDLSSQYSNFRGPGYDMRSQRSGRSRVSKRPRAKPPLLTVISDTSSIGEVNVYPGAFKDDTSSHSQQKLSNEQQEFIEDYVRAYLAELSPDQVTPELEQSVMGMVITQIEDDSDDSVIITQPMVQEFDAYTDNQTIHEVREVIELDDSSSEDQIS